MKEIGVCSQWSSSLALLIDLEQLLLLQLLAERFSWITLEACNFFFSLINLFLDGSFFFHPELSIVARCWGVRGLSGLRGAIRNLFGYWSLGQECASAQFLLCKFGPYFISSILFLRQIFLARKIRTVWGIKEKLARTTDVKHVKLEYKMQLFPMENRIILTNGVAATNKRWCCLFCSLHNLYVSKDLMKLILNSSIRAHFWWKKPQPAVLQKLDLTHRRLRNVISYLGMK